MYNLEGKKISICGDLAAGLDLTETFIQMGIDELSDNTQPGAGAQEEESVRFSRHPVEQTVER